MINILDKNDKFKEHNIVFTVIFEDIPYIPEKKSLKSEIPNIKEGSVIEELDREGILSELLKGKSDYKGLKSLYKIYMNYISSLDFFKRIDFINANRFFIITLLLVAINEGKKADIVNKFYPELESIIGDLGSYLLNYENRYVKEFIINSSEKLKQLFGKHEFRRFTIKLLEDHYIRTSSEEINVNPIVEFLYPAEKYNRVDLLNEFLKDSEAIKVVKKALRLNNKVLIEKYIPFANSISSSNFSLYILENMALKFKSKVVYEFTGLPIKYFDYPEINKYIREAYILDTLKNIFIHKKKDINIIFELSHRKVFPTRKHKLFQDVLTYIDLTNLGYYLRELFNIKKYSKSKSRVLKNFIKDYYLAESFINTPNGKAVLNILRDLILSDNNLEKLFSDVGKFKSLNELRRHILEETL